MAHEDSDDSVATSIGAGEVLQYLGIGLLALVALGCLHGLLYHLHAILVPFVLSAFIVLAMQPMVDIINDALSGKVPPYRWCMCCRRRRRYNLLQEDASQSGKKCQEFAGDWCCMRPAEDAAASQPLLETPRGSPLKQGAKDCCENFMDGLCRCVAVTVALALMAGIVTLIVLLIAQGYSHMKENYKAYADGLRKLERRQDKFVSRVFEDLRLDRKLERRLKDGYNNVLEKLEETMWSSINSIIVELSEGVFLMVWIMLYVLFWLFQPLPFAETAGNLVRSYMYKKTLVSALYGLCVTLLFIALGIDLAVLFGVVSFFLNYVPEVGAIISMVIPIPVILLDGRIENPVVVLILASLGQGFLKFIFGNILEVKLVERDRKMSIHPVWVVFGLSYFGFVWGPIGMLISVPMLALLKTAASSTMEAGYSPFAQQVAESLLTCLEGRRTGSGQQKADCEGGYGTAAEREL